MSNYEYANGAGLSVLSQKIFEHLSADLDLKADKATTYTKTEVDNLVDTDVVTSEAANPLILETDAAQYAKNTHLTLAPIQDLHGYDHPWPAGGGKNLLPLTVSNVKSRNTDGTWNGNTYTYRGITFTLNANEDGSITSIVANGTAGNNANLYLYPVTQSQNFPFGGMILSGGAYGGAYIQIELVNSPYTSYAKATGSDSTIDSAVSQQGTATVNMFARVVSGETVSNAVFKPMIRLSTESDATFAPYSNICPISGLDEVTVERTGFNIWDEEYTASGGQLFSKNPIKVIPNKTYYFKSSAWAALDFYDENDVLIDHQVNFAAEHEFTVPSGTAYMHFIENIGYGATYNHDISINYPSTDHDYHPYQDTEVSVPLPTTIYGGTLNLETGVVVVDMAMVKVSDLTWARISSQFNQSTSLENVIKRVATNSEKSSAIMSCYMTIPWNDNDDMSFSVNITGRISVTDRRYSSVSDWFYNMANEQICYELATPITYHLTPAQLDLLKGTNVITVNAKTVQVTYREGSLATLEELNAISFDLSHVKSKLPPIIIKDGMLQVTYDDGQ